MRHHNNHPALWFAVFLLAAGTRTVVATAITLDIKPHIVAAGSKVRLVEMVKDPTALPREWRQRMVIDAPDSDGGQIMPLATIAYALQRYPDMNEIHLRGNLRIRIERERQRVDPTLIKEAVEAYIRGHEAWESSKITIKFGPVPQALTVPAGVMTIEVAGLNRAADESAFNQFRVNVLVEDDVSRTVSIYAKVFSMEKVWVATRPLQSGLKLSADDVRIEFLPRGRHSRHALPIDESPTGFDLNRSVQVGQPILTTYLRTPLCAKRGEWIMVTMGSEGMQVTLRAKAMDNGRLGDRILCLNERSRRQILVQLTGDHEAKPVNM